MISELLKLLAEEVEKEVCLRIENDELKTGIKLSREERNEVHCQKVISKFEKFIDRLREAGCLEQDIYNVMQMAESESEDNEWFAGIHFGHSPNGNEKFEYWANHTDRPKFFEKKFRDAVYKMFEQPELSSNN